MKKYITSILLISNLYSESIIIHAEESAEYYASGSGTSGCCTPSILGPSNQTTLNTRWCQWWSQYGQCESRSRYALWRFDLSVIPENVNIINASFLAQGGGNWIQSFMSISNYDGPISLSMASHLANGGDWALSGQGEITTPVNQTIPANNITSAYNTGQLSVMFHMYNATISNVGVNAPRIVIEYEIEIQECSEMNESECISNDCNWVENTDTGTCSSLSVSVCDLPEYGSCYSDCTNWGSYYGGLFCYGTMYCTGGSYQSDNSYCEENSYELGDVNQDSIINIQDVIIAINLILSQEYDLSADINLDSTINVLDVIQLVNIILN